MDGASVPQLPSLTHVDICWDEAQPTSDPLLSTSKGLSSAQDLSFHVWYYLVPSVFLWVHGNHFPVLHATLSSKRPSQGHLPQTLHIPISTAPVTLSVKEQRRSIVILPGSTKKIKCKYPPCQVVPKPTWIYCQFSHPSSLDLSAESLGPHLRE